MKKKATSDGRPVYYLLIKHWIHQGFFYLDSSERIARILLEIIPIIVLYLLFKNLLVIYLGWFGLLLLCLFVVHTINWILFDNWWTVILFTFPKLTNPGEEATIKCRSSA